MSRRPAAFGAVAVTCLLGAIAAAAAQGRGATPVRVETLRSELIQPMRMVTGEVRARRRSQVASREPGLVLEFPVVEGQPVEAGALLARLDDARLRIEIEQVEADGRIAEAIRDERRSQLDQGRRDAELVRSSFERGAANAKEVQDAQFDVTAAEARLAQATQRIDLIDARARLLRRRLEEKRILAPFAGIVVARHTEQGQWLGEGEAVVEVVSIGAVEVWLNVPQLYLQPVQADPKAIKVEIAAAGGTVEPTGRRVIPQVDPRSRSFTVVATVDDPGGRIAPGMSVTAWVPTAGRAEHLTLPRDAVLRNDAGPFVYVARAAGPEGPALATALPVEVLFPAGDRLAVRAPALRPGDLVIVEGNERLFPMMPVAPTSGDDAPAADGEEASS
ncbi:MAG: efflux RND transporter periplasmic adaptor subunit [Planctomycetota bacterium]|jgi:multidrug efflux system membrane fusion protein